MIKFRSEETISRPIEEVRAFLGNQDRYGEWMPVEDVHMISGAADKTGSTMGMLMGGPGGRKFNMEFVIAEATPRRFVWRSLRGGPMHGEWRAELDPIDDAHTTVVYAGEIKLKGLWRLLTPIVAREFRSGEANELRRMKEILEAAPVAAG